MKVAGIISEYNPFHNGHLYQIEETKKNTGCDCTVAVMSGNFVMRGEAALYNKFIRAKSAVLGGVDLVLELSVPYALSSSEYFAYGGVSVLDSLNVTDFISFGSEEGDISSLARIADFLSKESTIEKIKKNQKKGVSVFSAISEEFFNEDKRILEKPNNILAINYLKALKRLDSEIIPYTVKRKNVGYNEKDTKENFASATGIREMLKNNEDISEFIPKLTYDLLKEETPVFEDKVNDIITYSLRIKKPSDLLKYADVNEGIENLIIKTALNEYGIKDIAMGIKSKRYTYTRIKRILYNILLDIDKEEREIKPQFARVLAFNEKGKELLSQIKKKSDIPVFTNITKDMYKKYEILNTDLKASYIYHILSGQKNGYVDKILL